MSVLGIHQRIAELWQIQKRNRQLTQNELDEMAICMDEHCNWVWKMIKLENLSLLASKTNDPDWQHEICRRIDQLKYNGSV